MGTSAQVRACVFACVFVSVCFVCMLVLVYVYLLE